MPGTPLAHPCASGEGVGGDGWSVEWEPTFGFPSLSAAVMAWVESNRRRVVNGSRELDLEISKAHHYDALEAAGIRTPDSVVVAGKELLVEAARQRFGGGRSF